MRTATFLKGALRGKYSLSLTWHGMFVEVKESAVTHGKAVRQYSRVMDSQKGGRSKLEALQSHAQGCKQLRLPLCQLMYPRL